MAMVVRSPRGTAYRRFLEHPTGRQDGHGDSGRGEPARLVRRLHRNERERKPDIAVVVLAENQGEGAEWAAPIFRRVVESYFFGRPFMPYPWESQIGVWTHADPRGGRRDGDPLPLRRCR